MFTVLFWKATAERVVRGAAVAVAAVLGLDGTDTAVHQLDAAVLGKAALYGALGSLVLSLIGGAVGKGDGPALLGQEVTEAPLPKP